MKLTTLLVAATAVVALPVPTPVRSIQSKRLTLLSPVHLLRASTLTNVAPTPGVTSPVFQTHLLHDLNSAASRFKPRDLAMATVAKSSLTGSPSRATATPGRLFASLTH